MSDQNVTIKSEAEAVASLACAAIKPTLNVERLGLAVFPDGKIKSLFNECLEDIPKRKRANVALYEAYSFVEYINAHKETGYTHIFGRASETGGEFKAVMDYHGETETGSPQWGEHNVSLKLETTPEWRRWIEKNNQQMTQEAFSEFIEDNMNDIIRPDAGTLIDVTQLLQGKKSVNFKSGKNLKNGAITLEYSEVIESTGGRSNGDMQVPDKFVLGICPFVGSAGVELEARLRFRISDTGKLTFAYILNRPFKVIEAAFEAARKDIQERTTLIVHLGSANIVAPPQPY